MTAALLPISRLPRQGLPAQALVCGDPARARRIAGRLEEPRQVAANREYESWLGGLEGEQVLVSSHGVGAPGAMCLFHELAEAGVATVIRVGTCGALAAAIEDGDLVVASAAVRDDGVSQQLVPPEYPAAATPEVVLALESAARRLGHRFHRGVVWTKSLFYTGLLTPPRDLYERAGAVALEMELSALLVLAGLRGLRAGGVLTVDGSPRRRRDELEYDPHRPVVAEGVERAIEVALEALVRLRP